MSLAVCITTRRVRILYRHLIFSRMARDCFILLEIFTLHWRRQQHLCYISSVLIYLLNSNDAQCSDIILIMRNHAVRYVHCVRVQWHFSFSLKIYCLFRIFDCPIFQRPRENHSRQLHGKESQRNVIHIGPERSKQFCTGLLLANTNQICLI